MKRNKQEPAEQAKEPELAEPEPSSEIMSKWNLAPKRQRVGGGEEYAERAKRAELWRSYH